MANVSKLLHTTVEDESFLLKIDPNDGAKKALLQARTKIRERLRESFAFSSRRVFGKTIEPRFFTQGSYSYKTLNDPAWPPDQQMDLDDGCYLPLSFVRGARPSHASAAFFEFVDGVLEQLAKEEGWKREEKDTCSRLVISSNSHIDIPLYAIPDGEFMTLQKSMSTMDSFAEHTRRTDTWDALPSDSVLLAHRTENWRVSDPRKIKTWFLNAVEVYGEKFRRICRYLKAWRDYHKPDLDEVSSILLMVCAWQAFEVTRRSFIPSREDEALLIVLERLPAYLEGAVANPTDKDEDINRVSEKGRKVASGYARDFADQLRRTISSTTDATIAVAEMQMSLGVRLPNRPDLVGIAETAKVTVLSQPCKQVAAPVVGRSQSG